MSGESRKAAAWAIVLTLGLVGLIVAGSRNLAHFDAALVAYTFASLFATFGITYRYAMWLQRPPTAVYWRRGFEVFLRRGHLAAQPAGCGSSAWAPTSPPTPSSGSATASAASPTCCSCGAASSPRAITFPLVFGWIHFEALADRPDWYRTVVFGFPTAAFPVGSLLAFLVFHGLVWSAFLVIAGVMLAMRRRMRDEGRGGGAASSPRTCCRSSSSSR